MNLVDELNRHLQFHAQRVKLLNEYKEELRKPGFKRKNEWILMGTTQVKYANIVVAAGNTNVNHWGSE